MFSENLEQLELVGPDAHSVVDSTTIWLTSMAAAITVGFFLSPMPEVLRVWRGVTHFDSLHIDSLLLATIEELTRQLGQKVDAPRVAPKSYENITKS